LNIGVDVSPRSFENWHWIHWHLLAGINNRIYVWLQPWSFDIDDYFGIYFLAVTRQGSVFKLIRPRGGGPMPSLFPHVLNRRIPVDTQSHTFLAFSVGKLDASIARERRSGG